ncbi:acyl-CoA dehydrogenase [Pseudomaricurvus alkylphenolicus]|uniref:acyl-CoA dehydrogenase family protein n=1 Tax=Pseudomaricurvus alkylphenolicus TaxID=1306991 RepID=UPI001423673E|nr:acyl-CoA dehydrogenase [Pseudomaricurvus alkylphenolicus]NIB42343.1 acyl-CoA dehydrogenase [Pseudomaricurvus alkylphenolicus]
MSLSLNEEQMMLQDSARGFLQTKAPVSAFRELRDHPDKDGFNRQLWADMAAQGWAGITIPEQFGGVDFGYTGLGLILEEMGRTLTVSPMVSTVLMGATALNLGGSPAQKTALLPKIATGELIIPLALEETRHHNPEQTSLRATPVDKGYCLNGRKVFVLDAHVADTFIVLARTSEKNANCTGLSLFLVDSDTQGVTVERAHMLDSRNAGAVVFNDVTVSSESVVGEIDEGQELLQSVLDVAQIGLSAELLGISQQVFEMTLSYLKERKQFGVHIGSFQALQHRMAQMFCQIELCKSIVRRALNDLDAGHDNVSIVASAAKAKLCETVRRLTNEAIQLHGGIGMTDEFDLGFYIKRARVAQQTCGDYNYHLDRFARLNGY